MIEERFAAILSQIDDAREASRQLDGVLSRLTLSIAGDALDPFREAELRGVQKALDAVVKLLESCNDRIVPIGWDKSAWETFCLHRYGAADDVRAMKPEDILTER